MSNGQVIFHIIVSMIIFGILIAFMICSIVDTIIADYRISTESYESGTFIVGKRFTRPDTYELCYREQFENGLGVERWVVVNREEYINTEINRSKQ